MNIRIDGKVYSTLDPRDMAEVLALVGSTIRTERVDLATLDPDARSLIRKLSKALDAQGVICAEMKVGGRYYSHAGGCFVYVGRVDNGQYVMKNNRAYRLFDGTEVFNV